jgi:hypothetical protein
MLLLLAACASAPWGTQDSADSNVLLQGYIYDHPLAADDEVLVGGDLELMDLGGQPMGEATASGSTPGYYGLSVPPEEPYRLRVGGDRHYTAVWMGVAPERDGFFFPLFSFHRASVDAVFEDLEVQFGGEIDTESGELVHVWGRPLQTGMTTADLSVTDGQGSRPLVMGARVDAGVLVPTEPTEPVDYFFAFNLAPGDVEVAAIGDQGQEGATVYVTEPGDVVAAFYFQGP